MPGSYRLFPCASIMSNQFIQEKSRIMAALPSLLRTTCYCISLEWKTSLFPKFSLPKVDPNGTPNFFLFPFTQWNMTLALQSRSLYNRVNTVNSISFCPTNEIFIRVARSPNNHCYFSFCFLWIDPSYLLRWPIAKCHSLHELVYI